LLAGLAGLVEENAVEVFHHYGVHLSSSLLIWKNTGGFVYDMYLTLKKFILSKVVVNYS
jgi:hypothetical protein